MPDPVLVAAVESDQRIARALVSDMVVYNGDRRDQSLAAGTLKRFGLNVTDVVGGFQAWRGRWPRSSSVAGGP